MEKNKRSSTVLRIILSILVAAAVWLYVDIGEGTSVRTTVHDVPVEFIGENTTLADRNLMLISGYDATVDLWLEGPRSALWRLNKNDIRVVANTSSITSTGTQSLTYETIFPDNVPRNSVSVERASVYAITVTVGELSTKEIPVYCDVVGEVADGFFTETVQLDPATLVLRGQRDDLVNVSYAKIELDADGASKEVVQGIAYTLYDYNDIPVESESIRTSTKMIQATLPVKTTKVVPLVINYEESPGSSLAQTSRTLVPSSVTLSGEKDTLDGIDSIILDTIYLQDLLPYQSFEYTVSAPSGTVLEEDSNKATLTIVVNNVIERTLVVSDFRFTNVPEGYTATAVSESLNILVRGITSEVESLTPEDITVTASLADITTAGDYTVSAQISMSGHPNVGEKGRYQIIVNVSETVEEPTDDETEPLEANGPEDTAD
ncbi:MAG: hypothetical protein E7426_01730 [Ruminococcaceae bacterium]|jgi:YbbR domain-containing protein|nr:hypothetical protein [Oscillospiraceae bacterium]